MGGGAVAVLGTHWRRCVWCSDDYPAAASLSPPPHTLGPCPCPLAGRIHMVQLRAGAHFFPCSITVLDQDGMEFLFGLDNLKRHQVRAGQAGGAGRGGGGQWTVGWWRG